MFKVGFTGTRKGLAREQHASMRRLMRVLTGRDTHVIAHHGCCVGADQAFAQAAHELGWYVIGHPSDLPKYTSEEAKALCDEVMPEKDPLLRNGDIVAACEILIACPLTPHEIIQSGTWSTVRKARKAGRVIHLVRPDGVIDKEAL